ncbi:hypothetical protein SPAB_00006 [Salmonella enterica subsp. enterica serovar Paratyphi B str. SPB7]|uniref:Uncharacterized protein n=1 Tax=Salmonella paratyphi B (strain ATCC BAA-1250 / SPB7) TaxID=1016998 RepID=A0A6C6YWI9_SALPB|nr:hypothetical protein SPAB_00006 [Salmonella enterica subsp. enterica serovar Paratyphi B str. SPB7]
MRHRAIKPTIATIGQLCGVFLLKSQKIPCKDWIC